MAGRRSAAAKWRVWGNELRVLAKSRENLSLEEWTFGKRGSFFEEVFGLQPVLEKAEE